MSKCLSVSSGSRQFTRIFIHRQYFLVVIKDRSLQLWDLKNLTVLREMPSNFNSVTALVCFIELNNGDDNDDTVLCIYCIEYKFNNKMNKNSKNEKRFSGCQKFKLFAFRGEIDGDYFMDGERVQLLFMNCKEWQMNE